MPAPARPPSTRLTFPLGIFSPSASALRARGAPADQTRPRDGQPPGPEEGEEDLASNTIGGSLTCRGHAVRDDELDGPPFDVTGTTAVGGMSYAAPTDLS